jgi:hypothetical protein
VLLSTATAVLLTPRLGLDAVGLWAGGVLIDVDHYVWYCIRQHDASPRAAVRFFEGAHPSQTPATRVLHHPLSLLAVLALAARRRGLRSLAVGMIVHVGLDGQHVLRMNRARAEALERDRFACRTCGAQARQLDTHLFRQPALLPSYRASNLVSLCAPCHEVAHDSPGLVGIWS